MQPGDGVATAGSDGGAVRAVTELEVRPCD